MIWFQIICTDYLDTMAEAVTVESPDEASAESTESDYFTSASEESESESTPISACLLYTSPSPRDATLSRMPSSA